MKQLKRGSEIIQTEGVSAFIHSAGRYLNNTLQNIASNLSPRHLYRIHVRPRTEISKDETVQFNGVTIRPNRSFDQYLPWSFVPANPSMFESGSVEALQEHVQTSDTVVVIGGGKGVTTVTAARESGEEGRVIVYEGATNMVEQIHDTLSLNNVTDQVKVHHAVVGSAKRLDGHEGKAETIQGNEVPECDVLEMDCEGAEIDIIPDLDVNPRHIIVESHGNRDEIRKQLSDLEYNIVSENVAEVGPRKEIQEERGIYTIVAEYAG